MKVENAKISWLESGLPYSTEFQDIYYSQDDELAESRHVFLEANKLRQRWELENRDAVFHIGELGFGSGLNFLQVAELWAELTMRPSRLHYLAFEKHPLTLAQLRKIHTRWPSLAVQSEALLEQYTDHGEGCHRILLDHGIILDLYYGDAQEQLEQRITESCPAVQCWFLDGFSPANNSELWGEELMELLARCSEAGSTVGSYSVAGKVRAALKHAGFEVRKIEGFGRKRHCLSATMPAAPERADDNRVSEKPATPWFTLPRTHYEGKSVAVIGAGLAGCSSAYSLARRGWQVTVVDAAPGPARDASGISQMALRCRVFNAPTPEARFYLSAYLFALRQFTQLQRDADIDWTPCGLLQLANAMNKRHPLQPEKLKNLYSDNLVQYLSRTQASTEAGVGLTEDAWFFPSGGSVVPSSLCRTYLEQENIDCLFGTRVTDLVRTNEKWQVGTDRQERIDVDAVVVANSHGATQFAQFDTLPLQALRGQTTEITANTQSNKLEKIVSGARTVFPSRAGRHLLAASYVKGGDMQILTDHSSENIAMAARNFKPSDVLQTEAVVDSVALRCNSPDRMPLVGMAPNLPEMGTSYAALSKNAKAKFSTTGKYHAGLYLNVAHGSNGLASCPLSAEYLASLITSENLPLSRDMADALNPARFLIRDLKKQK